MLAQARQRPALVAPLQVELADDFGSEARRQFALLTGDGHPRIAEIVKCPKGAGNETEGCPWLSMPSLLTRSDLS